MGLVGKQATLDALLMAVSARSKAAADDGIGFKSMLEDHAEGLRDVRMRAIQDNETKEQVEGSHDRHQLSVTEAIRLIPPRKIKPARAATIRPMTQPGMPNALVQASAMELTAPCSP